MKNKFKMFLVGILSISLAACGAVQPSKTQAENSQQEGYPIEIQHAFGTSVLESKPERIATVSWGNQDVPLALGVVPVGMSKGNFGKLTEEGLLPWTAKAIQELQKEEPVLFDDTDGLDFEAIADTKPDVILAAYSGLTQEDYETLSQIAPVVAYPQKAWQTLWREQVQLDAKGMGMEQEGKKLIEETDTWIKEQLKKYPQIEGKSAAFLWVDASDTSSFYVYLPKDPRAAYLMDLGLSFPEALEKLGKETEDFSLSLSSEQVDLLNDVDILVTYGDSNTLKGLQNDALFSTIPAVQKGSVVVLDSQGELAGAATPTVLSIRATLDAYLKELAKAADQL